jgi:hypothetical protein
MDVYEIKPFGPSLREFIGWVEREIKGNPEIDRKEYLEYRQTATALRIDAERFDAFITPEGGVELPLNFGRRIISRKDEGRVAMSDPEKKYFTMMPSAQVTRMLEANNAQQNPEGAEYIPADNPEPAQVFGGIGPRQPYKRAFTPEDDKLGRLTSFITGNYPQNPQLADQIIQLADAFQGVVDRANRLKRDEGRT